MTNLLDVQAAAQPQPFIGQIAGPTTQHTTASYPVAPTLYYANYPQGVAPNPYQTATAATVQPTATTATATAFTPEYYAWIQAQCLSGNM